MHEHDKMWEELGLDVELHHQLLESIGKNYHNTVESQKNRPQSMAYFDGVIHASHGDRVKELIDAKNRGEKIAGTFCIYVPEEIAMAVDVIPLPLCGGTNFSVPYAEKMFPRDICPLVKSTLGLAFSKTCPYAPIKNMAVGETTCDAKKKTWEILAGKVKFHVMEVPNKKEDADRTVWKKEVINFLKEMESLAGEKVTFERLKESIGIMNQKRKALHEFSDLRASGRPPISGLDALVVYQSMLNDEHVRFTKKLKVLNDELKQRISKEISPFDIKAKRIMVSGCPSVMGNWKLHHIIESTRAAVVADETCTGSRYFENLVDDSSNDLNGLIEAIADRYMKINCSCFTPNNERIEDVQEKVDHYKIDGVVQYILQYCHTYNIEAIRVESALRKKGVPNLKIETDYSSEDSAQISTRVEAFLEQMTG